MNMCVCVLACFKSRGTHELHTSNYFSYSSLHSVLLWPQMDQGKQHLKAKCPLTHTQARTHRHTLTPRGDFHRLHPNTRTFLINSRPTVSVPQGQTGKHKDMTCTIWSDARAHTPTHTHTHTHTPLYFTCIVHQLKCLTAAHTQTCKLSS